MQLIENKITIKDFINLDIYDKSFDDTENMLVDLVVVFKVELSHVGITVDVYEIKSINWSYTGVKFTDDENEEHQVKGSSDETWKVNINKSKNKDENYGLFIDNVSIDLDTKEIFVDFDC